MHGLDCPLTALHAAGCSFGSFHLLGLMNDEFLLYLVEQITHHEVGLVLSSIDLEDRCHPSTLTLLLAVCVCVSFLCRAD